MSTTSSTPTTSRIVALAQERGSAAQTSVGALRYLRTKGLGGPVRPLDRPVRTSLAREVWARARDEQRAERITLGLGLPVRPYPEEEEQLLGQLTSVQLQDACIGAGGAAVGPYRISAEQAVDEILRRVGPAGEQCLADEARYLDAYDVEQYESRKHSGRDWRGISRARVAADGSAAILSYVEAGSYLHKGSFGDPGAGGLHHLRIHAYLVLRDATTGERHILRVPPRFGSTRSATWRRARSAEDLIHAATAWTFGLRPAQYQPQRCA